MGWGSANGRLGRLVGSGMRVVRSNRRLWSARSVYATLLLVLAIIVAVAIAAPKLLVAVVVVFVSLWAVSAPRWLVQIGLRMRR
jgi:hypothetical protein